MGGQLNMPVGGRTEISLGVYDAYLILLGKQKLVSSSLLTRKISGMRRRWATNRERTRFNTRVVAAAKPLLQHYLHILRYIK